MQSVLRRLVGLSTVLLVTALCLPSNGQTIRVERLVDSPIIRPEMDGSMGSNIAGPSLIRVPDWIEQPLAICRWSHRVAAPSRSRRISSATPRSSRRTVVCICCTPLPVNAGSGSSRCTWSRRFPSEARKPPHRFSAGVHAGRVGARMQVIGKRSQDLCLCS